MAPNCRYRVRPERQRRGARPHRLSAQPQYRVAGSARGERLFVPFLPSHLWFVAVNQLTFSYTITWPTHRGTTIEPRADHLNSFKVASNDAHMETLESQVQDPLITNGAAEASTGSPPASPPAAIAPALSDPSTTAEQGKDGRRFVVASTYFCSLISESFCSSHYSRQWLNCTPQKV
jgi:hypothetical protein